MTTASTTAHRLPHAEEPAIEQLQPSLRSFALAAVGAVVRYPAEDQGAMELRYLLGHAASVAPSGPPWFAQLSSYVARPAECDRPLIALGRELGLTTAELLAAALAAAVEDDLMAGRAVAYLQAPIAGSRPTLGLMATAFTTLPDCVAAADEIAAGAAARSGLLALLGEGPMQERVVSMPPPIALALHGLDTDWPGISIAMGGLPEIPLASSILEHAARHARALTASASGTLVVRSGSMAEARTVACAIATKLQRRAAFIGTERITGLGPWLSLRGLVPVFVAELAPGVHHTLPDIPGYRGPVLAVCGPDGTIQARGEATASWRVPIPSRDERAALWEAAIGDSPLAGELATDHRHSSGRISELGRTARHLAMLDGRLSIDRNDVTSAARAAETQMLGALAQSIADDVPDSAMVAPPALRTNLEALVARCRARDTLVDGLGPAARTRYHPGVRALFVGPSGTGKTLAASWLASRLGIPLYRVDLAAITSKYIGETEKNLAQLIARAEHAEIALLFDEADSLFGKRTDVKDSNDRFANAQTNYLLQRIETFDGIAILTSNSRARFDSAFSRRLDAIVEFPAPGPEERRALWLAHLGDGHALSATEINQIAATADLAGGHIRNAVFAAATAARTDRRPIGYGDVVNGVTGEYRKLGRQSPAGLTGSR